ncbi:hypothetical protein [Enterovirga sp. CN4-39]|uniref:hypothetical protein n=1 Tax=Enterovirga sp. CN4-39 TaxID=3400910 RepID=UPI003C0EC6D1
MAQAFAITTLHVCRKPAEMKDGTVVKPPEIEVVPAGAITDLTDEDFEAFSAAGAARRPTKVDRAKVEDEAEPARVEASPARAPKPAR